MKKVLIFSTAYFPFVGGAEVAVKEITDRISDIEFDMITARMDRKLPKFERVGNVNVYRMGFGVKALDKIILAKWGFLKALKLNKKNNYDIAWSIMASQASIAASLFKIFKKRVKLILTLQEGDEEEHLARYVFNIKFLYKILIRPWHILVFKKADFVTAISSYLVDRAIQNGIQKEKIKIVPNAVDIKHFTKEYPKEELNSLKNELNIKDGEKVLITTSRLVKKNAIDDVIKSLKYLPSNIKFLIFGIGEDLEKLKNLAKEINVEDRIKFLGQVDHKDLPKYLHISDVFLRPSLSEGLGNSFLEAMVAGVPVVGTEVGGIPDFLIDRESGLFCEVNNPESIVEKVKLLLENDELRKKIIENGRNLVKKEYNWDIIVKRIKDIF